MTRSRVVRFVFVCAALASIACSSNAFIRHADQAVTTAFKATNAARDAFVEYDGKHQLRIVREASTREAGEVALSEYHLKRERVERAFFAAYAALGAAAILIPLVENGSSSPAGLVSHLADAVKLIDEVRQAITTVKVL